MRASAKQYGLRPASAAAILGADWLVYVLGTMYELSTFGRISIWGAVFCAVVVFLVENVANERRPGLSAAKGLLAGAAVAAPGAALGTAVALAALTLWGALYLAQRQH